MTPRTKSSSPASSASPLGPDAGAEPTGWIGRPVLRVEDERLLRGQGRYVDDIALPGAAEAAFLRSPHAHARITSVDADAARALPGVFAVWTGDDTAKLPPLLNREELRTPPGLAELLDPLVREQPMPLLAGAKVSYVGQPVAVVFAENRYLAEDALELIDVRYAALPVVVDPDEALALGAPLLEEEWPDNRALAVATTVGDPERAFAEAHAVISETFTRTATSPRRSRPVRWPPRSTPTPGS